MVKRARRILFHLASLVSLIVAVCAVAMILRARYVSDRWTWREERMGGDGVVHARWWALAFTGRSVIVQQSSARFVPYEGYRQPLPPERFTYDFWTPGAMHWLFRQNPGMPNQSKTDWFSLGSAYAMTVSYGRPGFQRFRTFELALPLWVIAMLAAVLPVVWEIRYRRTLLRATRGRKGLCSNCGYDLRATPDRCPECGRATPNAI